MIDLLEPRTGIDLEKVEPGCPSPLDQLPCYILQLRNFYYYPGVEGSCEYMLIK